MPLRELRDLCIELNQDNTMVTETAEKTATQVNPFHDVIDLSSSEGKKSYQKSTQSLSNDQKCNGDSKDIIKFIERVQSKSEDFGWSTVVTNIGP